MAAATTVLRTARIERILEIIVILSSAAAIKASAAGQVSFVLLDAGPTRAALRSSRVGIVSG
jgi:hypothetical protein